MPIANIFRLESNDVHRAAVLTLREDFTNGPVGFQHGLVRLSTYVGYLLEGMGDLKPVSVHYRTQTPNPPDPWGCLLLGRVEDLICASLQCDNYRRHYRYTISRGMDQQ